MISRETSPRPANRPSRREDLITAAIELFALRPDGAVTVAEIVKRAGMTPAAFYYHFSSREQLLELIISHFARDWVGVVEGRFEEAVAAGDLSGVVADLLDEIEYREQAGRIYFLGGVAVPVLDAIRAESRARVISAAGKAVQSVSGVRRRSASEYVKGVALVTIYETAVRARLRHDEAYRALGPLRFREHVVELSRVACG